MRIAPDVVMVLENNRYPLDSRVRKEAESLVESGLSVEVLAPRQADRPIRERIRGVQVMRYPLPDGDGALLGTLFEYLVALAVITTLVVPRLVRSRKGILHVHNPPDFFFPLLWVARRRGWSTVFDHHDDAAGLLRAKLGRATPLDAVLSWMRKQSARCADLTIATNDTQRTLLHSDARKTVVVRNSPPAWFADHRPSACNGRARLVFLGELGVQDRVERAVDVLSLLTTDHRLDVELLIVGDGPQRKTIEGRATLRGMRDRVAITGWVPYEDVPALLASAHVGIDPASMSDVNHGSTMIKILEYLAVGLPVVATALNETKVTGAHAVIAIEDDSADAFATAVASLLTNPIAWNDAAQLARARGADLHWPAQATVLLDAYAGMPSRAPTPAPSRSPDMTLA
jgi:glycosyltransferase involved in cell wall biosynthesis